MFEQKLMGKVANFIFPKKQMEGWGLLVWSGGQSGQTYLNFIRGGGVFLPPRSRLSLQTPAFNRVNKKCL